jgi:hypothetical protein
VDCGLGSNTLSGGVFQMDMVTLVATHVVPEPPTIILLTLGVIGMGLYARRRIKRKRASVGERDPENQAEER